MLLEPVESYAKMFGLFLDPTGNPQKGVRASKSEPHPHSCDPELFFMPSLASRFTRQEERRGAQLHAVVGERVPVHESTGDAAGEIRMFAFFPKASRRVLPCGALGQVTQSQVT